MQIWVAGNVGVTGSAAITNWPAGIAVSGSGGVRVWDGGVQGISGSVALSNWPATVGVTGSVALTNWPAGIAVSGSGGVRVWDGGVRGISGSVALSNWPAGFAVSGSGGVRIWDGGVRGISGSVTLLPTANTNAASFTGSMGQLPGGAVPGVIKGSAGSLFKVWVTNRSTGSVWLQLFNSTGVPSGIPLASFLVLSSSVSASNAVGQSPNPLVIDFSPFGVAFGTGICLGLSSNNTNYVGAANFGTVAAPQLPFDTSVMYI
jgi:hypothetical protein